MMTCIVSYSFPIPHGMMYTDQVPAAEAAVRAAQAVRAVPAAEAAAQTDVPAAEQPDIDRRTASGPSFFSCRNYIIMLY